MGSIAEWREHRISELKNLTMDITQCEQWQENEMENKKWRESPGHMGL